ncbi:transcriptional regulator of aroF, aroG, tyrA and aromatic amino acid transport [Basfia succiniciproducens]|uniref:HTH-type transcriptional regulatory protein TyrR n=3 Tax=Pasteurellaceae TaxID=712 RepID=Q65UJ1_MANSM|nr:TyrR protein [[Mannheimia] succiniciproducens MBEL55E]SCX95406.1 transcriptional regulator of aroF, aroG, tyrA and aromatic amino acid transport [Basfia succiniciproducens]
MFTVKGYDEGNYFIRSIVGKTMSKNTAKRSAHFTVNQYENFTDVVALSPKMAALVEKAKKFALLDAPLLIQGETGTGKDLIAKACHNLSARKDQKFIAVNCAGLPDTDAESEMFGRADGDKTSTGFFEYANGGTVLLDGVAELSLNLQAKLLRFLNDGTFRRVGEEQEHYANVRVICTSQISLQHYVDEGKVRSDLFHRLNVLSLQIPPLRERKEDLAVLTENFVRQISRRLGVRTPEFDGQFLQYLKDYQWPGNVRELYNALYRACSLAEHNKLTIDGLNLSENETVPLTLEQFGNESLEEIMNNFEASVLRKFYEQYPSTRKLASRLGVSHTAIANKLKQYGIGK